MPPAGGRARIRDSWRHEGAVEPGFPNAYFNDRLVAVIDLLLQTPVPLAPLKVGLTEIKGECKSERLWVR